MQLIEKVEIQYFRSIYRDSIKNISDLSVITGKNDAGKSNVLKALNLFFNNQTDAGTDFCFSDDFNFRRLEEVRRDTIKGKQFIQIKITFNRGNQYIHTLPKTFTVSKKWLRTDIRPSVFTDDVERQLHKEGKKYSARSKSSLTSFLNKIMYLYIPAVKDTNTFSFALNQLQDCIYKEKLSEDPSLTGAIDTIASGISSTVEDIDREFCAVTGIHTSVNPPKNIEEFYNRSLNVYTQYGANDVEINKRGDGIRVRYIPSILNYIAKNSNKNCIWGFEEPENSLEYNMALQMSESICTEYSKNSTIFITSHSPAFICLEGRDNVSVYRCFNNPGDDAGTVIINTKDIDKQKENYPNIAEELGFLKIQEELYRQYNEATQQKKLLEHKVEALNKDIETAKIPILLTEGKTDAEILKVAWEKLYDEPIPFIIKSCDTNDEDSKTSCAGCSVLAEYLRSYRYDASCIVVGLFDNDTAGKRSYQLSNNFEESLDKRWKISKNKRAFAMLIPTPAGKELFEEYENLSIEFLFERADLEKTVDGKKLELVPKQIDRKCGNISLGKTVATEFALYEIKGNKVHFAEKVVPTLAKESFVNFEGIFKTVLDIIKTYN